MLLIKDWNCDFLQSYDATTHFESTVQDVISMYSKITGKVISSVYSLWHRVISNYIYSGQVAQEVCIHHLKILLEDF